MNILFLNLTESISYKLILYYTTDYAKSPMLMIGLTKLAPTRKVRASGTRYLPLVRYIVNFFFYH